LEKTRLIAHGKVLYGHLESSWCGLDIHIGKDRCWRISGIRYHSSSGSYIRDYGRNEAGGSSLVSIPPPSVSKYTRVIYTIYSRVSPLETAPILHPPV